MRSRAVAVVLRYGQLLVIGRYKHGRQYAVLPGGGIEAGESPREACLRELWEETGLEGKDPTPLTVPTSAAVPAVVAVPAGAAAPAHYFTVAVTGTDLRLGGPELERATPDDVHTPRWVSLGSLEGVGLVPAEAVRAVAAAELLTRG